MIVTDLITSARSAPVVVDAAGNKIAVQIEFTLYKEILNVLEQLSDTTTAASVTIAAETPGSEVLALAQSVYEGLSPEQVDELEQIILDRSQFFSGRE